MADELDPQNLNLVDSVTYRLCYWFFRAAFKVHLLRLSPGVEDGVPYVETKWIWQRDREDHG